MKKITDPNMFFRVPQTLFADSKFKTLPAEAKLMYGILLDRESLSQKNGWFDENGRVFIYYPIEEMAELLGCGRDKTMKLFKKLEEHNLIERHKKFINKPWCITLSDIGKSDFHESEITFSGSGKNRLAKVGKTDSNNTDINNTELSYTYSSYESLVSEVKEQLEYECLCGTFDQGSVDPFVYLICDTLTSQSDKIKIGDYTYSSSFVKNRLRSLGSEHIEYAIQVLSRTKHSIGNLQKYLLSVLFNAPSCMDSYYENIFNADQYEN